VSRSGVPNYLDPEATITSSKVWSCRKPDMTLMPWLVLGITAETVRSSGDTACCLLYGYLMCSKLPDLEFEFYLKELF